ncbi:DUF7448 domain-containing protein [Staphylococcus felis]|uniref:DUF7448 domain-containing protein n=1 Tax=Staphylococcus felis TaxID=46127 RepID=UPI00396719FD
MYNNYKEFEEIKEEILYKRVTAWTDETLTLDDGTVIEIVESEQDCCASAGGSWSNVKLDALITDVKIENEITRPKFEGYPDDESENLATVILYHNQNLIAQGSCYADGGNGDYYYSVCSLKIKDIHYPVVKHE